ncbi:isochorismate synthase [Histophilus somni]|uniref:Isochorismate synthase MenF n=1 Tax=Histophilus somni TaxID=731 RepID=A0AAX2RXN1_HISSO|nr:isochorismate synthase [Histophilus somni]QEH08525.1 isochorismate synthase [Histophilus somni]QEH12892.1 isochorismate synthase [Histophilus somni]QEH24795.1 isochorismate synthase [Histophilus somni]QEH27376.1 isochorismate synthase [Histophilus somni]QEH51577.1 isochorismate synthase [Histophilus somni]
MDNLHEIKAEFIRLINQYQFDPKNDFSVLRLDLDEELNLLGWLKAQCHYPQFYLNFRDTNKKILGLGEVCRFTQVKSAQTFVQQFNLSLIGGCQFNGEPLFILPRLSFIQEQKLVIQLIIDNKKPWEQEKYDLLNIIHSLEKQVQLNPIHQSIQLITTKANQTEWCLWVEKALHEIKQKNLTKVVLANETDFKTDSPLNAKDFLAESEKYNTGCYHFLFAQNNTQAFIGSTPERLYVRKENRLITEALAGTAFITNDEHINQQQAQWLLQDPKNIYENSLVVEGICQHLIPYVEEITVSELEIKQLRQVQHLKREISARLKAGNTDAVCLNAIHPTAAIAGLPQKEAKVFLQNTETFDRTWYAGALGIMTKTESEFCVTIRSSFIEQDYVRIFAGAGIVEGSIPLLEWQEIERKALGLISLLQKETE